MARFIQARKSLGQNFLHDPAAHQKIRTCIQSSKNGNWLEIGCGTGEITSHLLELSDRFVGVELDDRLIPSLQEMIQTKSNSNLIHASILDLKEEELLFDDKYCVLGNLPYYITSPILEHILLRFESFEDFFLMVQKEVGERILASSNSKAYSRLSVFCQLYCEVRKCFDVKRGCFHPAPKVDSIFLHLKRREHVESEDFCKWLLKIVKVAFSQRRKKASKLLKIQLPNIDWDLVYENCGLDLSLRAQALSVLDFKSIAAQSMKLSEASNPGKKR